MLSRVCLCPTTPSPRLPQGQQVSDDDENSAKSRVDKIYELMDQNGDNQLTFEEFKEGSKTDPRIVQALSFGETP